MVMLCAAQVMSRLYDPGDSYSLLMWPEPLSMAFAYNLKQGAIFSVFVYLQARQSGALISL